jgi:hypothetical protein
MDPEKKYPTNDDLPELDEYLEEEEFVPCQGCDGHDACEDFGCAFELGLGHMVKQDDWG